jgi:hypothetical protein
MTVARKLWPLTFVDGRLSDTDCLWVRTVFDLLVAFV